MDETIKPSIQSLRQSASEYAAAQARLEMHQAEIEGATNAMSLARHEMTEQMRKLDTSKHVFKLDGGRALVAELQGDDVKLEIVPCL